MKIFLPITLVFIILNGLIITFKGLLENKGFDRDFLIIANLLLYSLCIAGLFLQRKGLQSSNTHAFIRSVYSAMLLKIFVCMAVVMVYIFFNTSTVNKPALFASMGLYLIYTSIEVAALMGTLRKKKNA
jgi:hypothetical protein